MSIIKSILGRRRQLDEVSKKSESGSEQINEISVKLADRYLKKAVDKDSNLKPERVSGAEMLARKALKMQRGGDKELSPQLRAKVALTKEEAEQIDELSNNKLATYVRHAAMDVATKPEKQLQRFKGILKATSPKRLAKEEAEQIDEISYKTMDSYQTAAVHSLADSKPGSNTYNKRISGLAHAKHKKNELMVKSKGEQAFKGAADGRVYKEETESVAESIKRGRGRPKKRRNEAGEIIDDVPGVAKS